MDEFEQRRERRLAMQGQPERLSLSFARGGVEMRAKPNGTGGTTFRFEGYAATFGDPFQMWDMWGDPYTEVVDKGAFTRTLANGADVAFLIGHNNAGILMARTKSGTLTLTQDDHGVAVLAPALDGSREDVRALASAVERGDMDEMSCAFITRQQVWSPDFTQRNMVELDLHRGDVSAVVFGANAATAGSDMRSIALPPGQLILRRPVAVQENPELAERARAAMAAKPGKRAQDEIIDMSGAPDYNPVPHAYDPAAITCPNPDCTVAGGARNSPDAKVCDQCGQPLYDADGLIVMDDTGVAEEAEGSMGDADLHAAVTPLQEMVMRTRMLELTQ